MGAQHHHDGPITRGRFLVADVETTGLDPKTAEIVELGVVRFEDGRVTGVVSERFRPKGGIPPEATAIHHISNDDVADRSPFAECGWIGSLQRERVVGYNIAAFDGPLLCEEMRRAKRRFVLHGTLDPLIMVRWALPALPRRGDASARSLVNITDHFGVRLTQAHSAAADARATGELLLALVARGLCPDDWSIASAMQAAAQLHLDEERRKWGHWIYEDRERRGLLRLACGKHVGMPLMRAARERPQYIERLLEIPDIHPGAAAELRRALGFTHNRRAAVPGAAA